MALPGTRQSFIEDPDFNLGMTPEAFANLGLMTLPGANITVANPEIVRQLTDSVKSIPTYPTDLGPRVISDVDYRGPISELAPRAKTAVPTVSPFDMPPEPREIYDAGKTTTATPAVDTSNFPKFEGTPYDPAAYDKILQQLTAQSNYLKDTYKMPYTSTFGGTEETVRDLAKRLAAMGISDIFDFGMKHELPVEKVYETIYQDEGPALTVDTGKYQTISGFRGYDAERNPIFDYRELTPEEVEKLRFDKSGFAFLPSGQIKREDLGNTPYATTKYYNKKTGEEIDTKKFGSKAESGLFASSGAGEGYTNYRVMYNAKGEPVFVPEKELSGMKEFIAEDLSGILSVLRFIPGAQLPVMLAQAAAASYMGADPKDVLASMAKSYVASNLGNIVGAGAEKLGIDMPTTDLGKIAMQGGLGALSSLIQGGDLEQALRSGALTAAGTGISGLLPKGDGTFNYEKIIQALAPAIARGELSNADAFRLIGALVPGKKPPGKP